MKQLSILILLSSFIFTQELVKTNDGRLVILYENGTWEYVNSSKSNVKENNKSVGVFVTRTGKKYHRDGCRYLKSRIPISLNEAVTRGFTGCLVCSPPSLSTAPSKTESYTPKTNYESDGRCIAITQKGTRCKRNAQSGRSYCWQH